MIRLVLLPFLLLTAWTLAEAPPVSTKCAGKYRNHLQGICSNRADSIYWSFTTTLVKTDRSGSVQKSIAVEDHHGDLCFLNGKIYVAVNLGCFNKHRGNAESYIYTYDASTLQFLSRKAIPEVFHGAGGIAVKDGHFFVVGGLPRGIQENYVYEYDSEFEFLKKHTVRSGWTNLGIQTAEWHDNAWWFGCYGTPRTLIKTDPNFNNPQRFKFDCALGIIGTEKGKFLVAKGRRTLDNRFRGSLYTAVLDRKSGLRKKAPFRQLVKKK